MRVKTLFNWFFYDSEDVICLENENYHLTQDHKIRITWCYDPEFTLEFTDRSE